MIRDALESRDAEGWRIRRRSLAEGVHVMDTKTGRARLAACDVRDSFVATPCAVWLSEVAGDLTGQSPGGDGDQQKRKQNRPGGFRRSGFH
jgi:hypothetical protein